ncbi:hypothetical protein SAMN02799630_01234 [Paenibacillus sp. UNCCL117]|uniref:hypothetical protein n=1 Tax=unclassified Paenibacillus TaxID=185978 RepID=UPI000881E17E|nr:MULTISPECIES: hypothetical protein [unclassified Paenibacillus]SDC70444.1 hypothetical protein SAMN04488602_103212 [Paenibacillus sp. cl123]SFW24198.1 hypothetical protein SAMN02799630_01234 [Paenibacillus sp. UNCCL117]
MYRYAEIDEQKRVRTVAELSGEVELPNMILLGPEDDVNLGDIYEDGVWTPAPLSEPPEQPSGPTMGERIATLQDENADLKARLADVELIMAEILTGGGE